MEFYASYALFAKNMSLCQLVPQRNVLATRKLSYDNGRIFSDSEVEAANVNWIFMFVRIIVWQLNEQDMSAILYFA